MLPSNVAMFVIGLASGRIAGRVGSKLPVVGGALVAALAFLLIAVAHGAAWEMSAETGLMGFGIGAAFSALSNLVVESVPDHQTGVASGMNANIRTIGGSIGSQVCGSLIAATVVGIGAAQGVRLRHGVPLPDGHLAGRRRGRRPHPEAGAPRRPERQ